jgi:hypothetical protein
LSPPQPGHDLALEHAGQVSGCFIIFAVYAGDIAVTVQNIGNIAFFIDAIPRERVHGHSGIKIADVKAVGRVNGVMGISILEEVRIDQRVGCFKAARAEQAGIALDIICRKDIFRAGVHPGSGIGASGSQH